MLKEYLKREEDSGKMKEVDIEMFSFKRRYGVKQSKGTGTAKM